MSVSIYIQRFIITNVLTLVYSLLALFILLLNYVKKPFGDGPPKLRLEPPASLADPKYGTHKYIKVNNIKLHYVESGDPSKTLMIFIHGFPEFWYSWRHQIVEFQKDYWCIAVDMRGYGDSERPENMDDYKLEHLVEDVRDLVRQLGREKCILVSHDWGGLIASKYRDLHPDTLHAVILLGSTSVECWYQEVWNNPEQRKKSWYVFLYRMPSLPETLMHMNNLELFRKAMQVPGKTTIDNNDIECYRYWFGKQFALTPPINYYRANYQYYRPEVTKDTRKVPMLLANAENDLYLSHNLLDAMKKQYEFIETTIVPDCGHFLQQEEPAKVNKLIREFLAKHNM